MALLCSSIYVQRPAWRPRACARAAQRGRRGRAGARLPGGARLLRACQPECAPGGPDTPWAAPGHACMRGSYCCLHTLLPPRLVVMPLKPTACSCAGTRGSWRCRRRCSARAWSRGCSAARTRLCSSPVAWRARCTWRRRCAPLPCCSLRCARSWPGSPTASRAVHPLNISSLNVYDGVACQPRTPALPHRQPWPAAWPRCPRRCVVLHMCNAEPLVQSFSK